MYKLLAKELGKRVAALHGQMSQPAREASMESFRCGQAQYVVCTDVAARGLHSSPDAASCDLGLAC